MRCRSFPRWEAVETTAHGHSPGGDRVIVLDMGDDAGGIHLGKSQAHVLRKRADQDKRSAAKGVGFVQRIRMP